MAKQIKQAFKDAGIEVKNQTNNVKFNDKKLVRFNEVKGFNALVEKYGIEAVQFVNIIKQNYDIRILTAKGFRHLMEKSGELKKEDVFYLEVEYNKIIITKNGMRRDDYLDNEHLITAIIAAIEVFVNRASNLINKYLSYEKSGIVVSPETVVTVKEYLAKDLKKLDF